MCITPIYMHLSSYKVFLLYLRLYSIPYNLTLYRKKKCIDMPRKRESYGEIFSLFMKKFELAYSCMPGSIYIFVSSFLIYTGSKSHKKINRENVYILVCVSSFCSCIRQFRKKLLHVLEHCCAVSSFMCYIISVDNSILLHLILHIII